jgi:hypothetical protein
MPNCQSTIRPSRILVKVEKLVDSIQNASHGKFLHLCPTVFVEQWCKNHKQLHTLKIIISCILYKLQSSCGAYLEANEMLLLKIHHSTFKKSSFAFTVI